jgi:hypothetical protein
MSNYEFVSPELLFQSVLGATHPSKRELVPTIEEHQGDENKWLEAMVAFVFSKDFEKCTERACLFYSYLLSMIINRDLQLSDFLQEKIVRRSISITRKGKRPSKEQLEIIIDWLARDDNFMLAKLSKVSLCRDNSHRSPGNFQYSYDEMAGRKAQKTKINEQRYQTAEVGRYYSNPMPLEEVLRQLDQLFSNK